jgi:hypothetical protein
MAVGGRDSRVVHGALQVYAGCLPSGFCFILQRLRRWLVAGGWWLMPITVLLGTNVTGGYGQAITPTYVATEVLEPKGT